MHYLLRLFALVFLMVTGCVSVASAQSPNILNGTLSAVISDAPPHPLLSHQHSEKEYVFTPRGSSHLLPVDGSSKQLSSLEGQPVVYNQRRDTVKRAQVSQRTAFSSGPQETAVLLVNFANDTRTPFTAADIQNTLVSSPTSVDQFYRQQSNGAVSIVGKAGGAPDVYGWMTLPMTIGACDYKAVDTAARQMASTSGINLDGYDHVVYAFPTQETCEWAGLASMPGSTVWINGYLQTSVWSHEFGHNFGADHASYRSCRDTANNVTASVGNCTVSEYGDPYDVMGTGYTSFMSGWHRWQIGQMPDDQLQYVRASGDYNLVASNDFSANPGARTIMIPRRIAGKPTTEYIAIETRAPGSVFETRATDAYYHGVSVRIVPNKENSHSTLVAAGAGAAQPDAEDYENAYALMTGENFVDPDSGISITKTAGDNGQATVAIGVSPNGDTTAPATPGDFQAGVINKTTVRLAWTAAEDDEQVGGYQVFRNGTLLGTTPGLSFDDAAWSGLTSGTYTVKSVDAAGNVSVATEGLVVRFPQVKPPVTANTSGARQLKVVKSKSGKRTVYTFRWSAPSNRSNVSRYLVYKGSKLITTTTATKVALKKFNARKKQEFRVVVKLKSGEVGASSFLLYKSNNVSAIRLKSPKTVNGVAPLPANRSVSIGRTSGRGLTVRLGNKKVGGTSGKTVTFAAPTKSKPYTLTITGKLRGKTIRSTYRVEDGTIRPY